MRADVEGERSYDVTATGAAGAVREASKPAQKDAARKTTAAAQRAARQCASQQAVARGERQRNGPRATDGDLAIRDYETLAAEE